jgi:hypothetical protein
MLVHYLEYVGSIKEETQYIKRQFLWYKIYTSNQETMVYCV